MWLLNARTHQLEAFEGSHTPRYAILSHRWEADEVLFADVIERRHEVGKGWAKIKSCCQKALDDDLNYIWADTCCIDKKSSAELSEAINSMFLWYQKATICYAYLCDVTDPSLFTESVWFTRGWTLQELLAPRDLLFFDKDWTPIGSKSDRWYLKKLSERAGIPQENLKLFDPRLKYGKVSIAQMMSWAAHRQTTRVEDRAYSLMGMSDINMPLLYGEGEKAFYRLQEEIVQHSRDISILAWRGRNDVGYSPSIFAVSPDLFAHCNDYGAIFTRYSVTKHELNVDTDLYSCSREIYAIPVAQCRNSSYQKDIVCTLLIKQDYRTKNETYYRIDSLDTHILSPLYKKTGLKRIEIIKDESLAANEDVFLAGHW